MKTILNVGWIRGVLCVGLSCNKHHSSSNLTLCKELIVSQWNVSVNKKSMHLYPIQRNLRIIMAPQVRYNIVKHTSITEATSTLQYETSAWNKAHQVK